jgi:hypothetical protein
MKNQLPTSVPQKFLTQASRREHRVRAGVSENPALASVQKFLSKSPEAQGRRIDYVVEDKMAFIRAVIRARQLIWAADVLTASFRNGVRLG